MTDDHRKDNDGAEVAGLPLPPLPDAMQAVGGITPLARRVLLGIAGATALAILGVVGIGVVNRVTVLDLRDAGRAALMKGEWEEAVANFDKAQAAWYSHGIVILDRSELEAEVQQAHARLDQVQLERRRDGFGSSVRNGDFPTAVKLAALPNVAAPEVRREATCLAIASNAIIAAMSDGEFADFVAGRSTPSFLDGLQADALIGLRARAELPNCRDLAQKEVAAHAAHRAEELRVIEAKEVKEVEAARAQPVVSPFRIVGRVLERDGPSLLVWGRAMLVDPRTRWDEGAQTLNEVNILVESANLREPSFHGVGLPYVGDHYYRGKSAGVNQVGGPTTIFHYGTITPEQRGQQQANDDRFQAIVRARLRVQAGDPEQIRSLGVKQLLPGFE